MGLSQKELDKPPFADRVLDPAPPVAHGGSTDTADVSWNCPTVPMHVGCWVPGTPNHSWQTVTQGKNHYARQSMLYTAKVFAVAAVRLLENPEILAAARAEHTERTGGKYEPAMPKDVMPHLAK